MSEAEPSVVPTWAVFGVVALACLFVAELGEGLVAGKKAPPVTIQSLVGEGARCLLCPRPYPGHFANELSPPNPLVTCVWLTGRPRGIPAAGKWGRQDSRVRGKPKARTLDSRACERRFGPRSLPSRIQWSSS